MIKAILFDFDGVIANTIPYHIQAWQRVLKPLHLSLSAEDVAVEEGASALEIIRNILAKRNISLPLQQIRELTDQKRNLYCQITRAHVYPETKEFIERLKGKPFMRGLVTGSIISAVETVTGKDFLTNFHVIVTSDDVQRNKPDPEPFLRAAEKLNIPPPDCLVIENAPKGIQAAKEAGMYCIALKTTIKDPIILQRADLIVNHVHEIPIDSLERFNESRTI